MNTKNQGIPDHVWAEATAQELKRLRGPDEFELALIELMQAQKRAGIPMVTSMMPAGGNGMMTATMLVDGKTAKYDVRITDWQIVGRDPDLASDNEPDQK
ncbi:MAG: hypothetical protein JSR99_08175 [Proteobacteria bacterium]|nr:hypothetical protein [Pseudomonadota bacterium]